MNNDVVSIRGGLDFVVLPEEEQILGDGCRVAVSSPTGIPPYMTKGLFYRYCSSEVRVKYNIRGCQKCSDGGSEE